MQVTDSAVDNIRPSLADFLSHPDLPSVRMKSTVLFESSSLLSRGETKRKGVSHISRNGPRHGRIFIENRYPHSLRLFVLPFVRLTCMPRPSCIVRDCAFSDNAVFQFLSNVKGETRARHRERRSGERSS